MREKILISVIFIALLFCVVLYIGIPRGPLAIHGYSGLEGHFTRIEHSYTITDSSDFSVTPIRAIIDPNLELSPPQGDPSGLEASIGQPWVSGILDDWTNKYEENKKEHEVQASILTLRFGMTIKTIGYGLDWIKDISFFVEFVENSYDVFQGADDYAAYIIAIRTMDPVQLSNAAGIDVHPSAGNYYFVLNPTSTEEIPEWVTKAGYQGTLKDFKSVEIEFNVIKAANPWGGGSNSATWDCELQILLFGHWEHVLSASPWEPYIPATWVDMLVMGFWIILGIVFTLVAIVKLPGYWKLAGVIMIWLILWLIAFGGLAYIHSYGWI